MFQVMIDPIQQLIEQATSNSWLRRKLDRQRRFKEHQRYITDYLPELSRSSSAAGCVIDIGCGDGMFLEIAKSMGCLGMGFDKSIGAGGMGDDYVQLCELIRNRVGVSAMLAPGGAIELLEELKFFAPADIINCRGAIEQVFADFMDGPPHHEHHDCNRLSWREDENTVDAIDQFLTACFAALAPGSGVFLIHANGSKNHLWFVDAIMTWTMKVIPRVDQGVAIDILDGSDRRVIKIKRQHHASYQH